MPLKDVLATAFAYQQYWLDSICAAWETYKYKQQEHYKSLVVS